MTALFDGETYVAAEDEERLATQLERVTALMTDGEWRTLEEIQKSTGGSLPAVSARLRDLRKPRFGSFIVDRRRRGAASGGLHEYRISATHPVSVTKPKKNPFLEGMKRAAKIVLANSDFTEAKLELKKELIKVATR